VCPHARHCCHACRAAARSRDQSRAERSDERKRETERRREDRAFEGEGRGAQQEAAPSEALRAPACTCTSPLIDGDETCLRCGREVRS